MHAHICRVQKLKCTVLSHACKHKPDSHIMPYWSDRVCRKLAENTNTAWGGSLKLETSLLSMVFSSSEYHLVAHAYQVLSQSLTLPSLGSAVCCSACNGDFRRTTWNCQLISHAFAFWLLSERWSMFVTKNEKSSRRNHLCFTTCLCHGAVMAGLWGVYSYECNFIVKLKAAQVISTTATRTEQKSFPSFQCYSFQLSQGSHLQESQGGLCSTCQQYQPITLHNKAPPEQQWAAGSFRGYWRQSM